MVAWGMFCVQCLGWINAISPSAKFVPNMIYWAQIMSVQARPSYQCCFANDNAAMMGPRLSSW